MLSSVHTNSAAESAFRLLELGVPEYLVATSLTGVISQRLVRRLCRRCRIATEPPPDLLRLLLPDPMDPTEDARLLGITEVLGIIVHRSASRRG